MRNVWSLLARNRSFRLLLGANLTSSVGDWILATGLMFYVYSVTGSALASGAMLFMSVLPQLVLGSFAGVFVDRWDRRRTMVVSNLLLALSLTPLFFVHDQGQLWVAYLVVFLQGVLEQFFVPAEAAMVPHVVPAGDLVAANALNGQNRQIARLVGAALGGVLAATGGILLVMLVDLASYVLAAVFIAMIRGAVVPEPAERTRFRHEWRAGVSVCFSRSDLTTLFIFRLMNGFGDGVVTVLLTPLIVGVLHASSTEYGSVLSVQAIGGIAGGLAIAAVGRRSRPRLLLGYGALLFGAVNLVMVLYPLVLPQVWPIFVFIVLIGIPLAAQQAGFATLQQTLTPDQYRGRVFGAMGAGWGTAMLLGIVVASTLGDMVGIIAVISLHGIVHVIAGPVVLARLSPAPSLAAGDPVSRHAEAAT